ncbi:NAD(+) diphosphatase [Labedella endophytica]|nr:NAD(+) diphosphatase [Labedella endophytica]
MPVREDALVLERISPDDRFDADDVVYLGRTVSADADLAVGTPLLLVAQADAGDDEPEQGLEWRNPRDAAHRMSDRDAGIASEALAIAAWHRTSRFCANCGAETEVRNAGWMRACPRCGVDHFPRTDPAVIVRIVHEERILLGSSALWPAGRYSLLAGFVEAGESLEAAVLREVEEESGMRLATPIYLGSQPWPFPRSLMFGYHAELAPGQDPEAIARDEEELDDVRWFSREELLATDSEVTLPGPTSIARAIIDDWLRGDERS